MNAGYKLFGTLRYSGFDGLNIFRSVWKGVYEKRDAVIELGVYEKGGEWLVIKSAVYSSSAYNAILSLSCVILGTLQAPTIQFLIKPEWIL